MNSLIKYNNKTHFKKYYYLFYFCMMFLCITMFSCKDSSEPPPHYTITQELKEWGAYKKGSYWIYRNDSSMVYDSIFCYRYGQGESPNKESGEISSYTERILMRNTNLKNDSIDVNIEKRGDYNALIYNVIDNENKFRYFQRFSFTDKFIIKEDFKPSPFAPLPKYDSLLIDKIWYKNIVYDKHIANLINLATDSGYKDTIEYWLSKHVGVIKKVIHYKGNKISYSLIRYHAIQ